MVILAVMHAMRTSRNCCRSAHGHGPLIAGCVPLWYMSRSFFASSVATSFGAKEARDTTGDGKDSISSRVLRSISVSFASISQLGVLQGLNSGENTGEAFSNQLSRTEYKLAGRGGRGGGGPRGRGPGEKGAGNGGGGGRDGRLCLTRHRNSFRPRSLINLQVSLRPSNFRSPFLIMVGMWMVV